MNFFKAACDSVNWNHKKFPWRKSFTFGIHQLNSLTKKFASFVKNKITINFSAIIPSYNSESTLSLVIESIKKQKKKAFEVIVVDDCSTDNSSKIAIKTGCRLLSLEKNSGRGKVRNKGTTESKSPFLLFCDSSNVIDPCFSEKARHFDAQG